MSQDSIRKQITRLVQQYAAAKFAVQPFAAGETPVPASGKVIGAPELELMVSACLYGWLTTGRFNTAFEQKLSAFIGVRHLLHHQFRLISQFTGAGSADITCTGRTGTAAG